MQFEDIPLMPRYSVDLVDSFVKFVDEASSKESTFKTQAMLMTSVLTCHFVRACIDGVPGNTVLLDDKPNDRLQQFVSDYYALVLNAFENGVARYRAEASGELKQDEFVKPSYEEYWCWRESVLVDGKPELRIPWSDSSTYEYAIDGLFSSPEEAIEYLDQVFNAEEQKEHGMDEWLLCKQTVFPMRAKGTKQ